MKKSAICVFVLLLFPPATFGEAADSPRPAPRPVILLTGFELFGGGKTNASWEAVRNMDGVEWKGYTLAVRQLRVVWGEPVRQLDKAIGDLKPVAVFSFGQGRPDGFYFESLARNQRINYPDNNKNKPARLAVIKNGPATYTATADTALFAKTLNARGYPSTASVNAGRYLCEECLYSLEHLKSIRYPKLDVLFCHVPQLGVRIGRAKTPVTKKYLSSFAYEVLSTWYVARKTAERVNADTSPKSKIDKKEVPQPAAH